MDSNYNDELIKKMSIENILLDSLSSPVYYKDTKGKFIKCNSSFSKIVGIDKKDIMGKSAYGVFIKDVADRHKIIDRKIMKTLENNIDDIVFLMPNGELRYFVLNKSVYLNQDGMVGGTVCVMNDITNKLKQNEFLIQQNKLAEMGEMIASIAHQWHEPLVEISAQIQKIELNYILNKVNQNAMSAFVKDSMVQIKYMSKTLNDFRDFLKPSTEKKYFGIKKAIKEIFEIVGKQIFYFNIAILFDYDDKEIDILGYKNEFKQVLLNIINNAKYKIVKANESKKLNGLITIKIYKSKKNVKIEIRDNAGAIDKNIMKQIFEPYFTTKNNGTGFGLYMSKIIIEKMSGTIEVRNNDKDVVFSIKIPK